jgi:hypothetical protein
LSQRCLELVGQAIHRRILRPFGRLAAWP